MVEHNVPCTNHDDGVEPGYPPWCRRCGGDVRRWAWVATGEGARRKARCNCSEYEWRVWRHHCGWRELQGVRPNGRRKALWRPVSFEIK